MTKDPLDAHARRMDLKARGPEPDNPFTELRERNGWTLPELAKRSNINIMALDRSESGCYTLPLPSLVDFWVKWSSENEARIITEYEEYVLLQRRRNKLFFGPSLLTNPNSDLHPLRQLRALRPSKASGLPLPVGITELSKSLCLPLDTLQFFEKKLTQRSVPKSLKLALNQNGYDHNQIAGFEANYKDWREFKLSTAVTFS